MPAAPHLADDERFPLIPEERRGLLRALRQDPAAPRFTMACGDRLTAEGLAAVRAYEAALAAPRPPLRAEEVPAWARAFAARVLADVPFHRARGGSADDFHAIRPVTREELAAAPWRFVPDSAPLHDLIVYYTSGASGAPMNVLAHPTFASQRIPLLKAALASRGIALEGGADRVSILFVCSQETTLTYASLSSALGGAGHVKVNLNPADWRDPADRVAFVERCAPEIVTGDPLSLADLAALPVSIRPKALVSSAMTLLPGMRRALEERFGCPVADFYSTCETHPLAISFGGDFTVLPHDVFVEVVDPEGRPCAEGERGAIAVTGGRNPFLPLLRYLTGDHAAMRFPEGVPTLVELEGRAPVTFRHPSGRRVNNIDVTIALRPLALPQFAVHQAGDGSLTVRLRDLAAASAVERALRAVFGDDIAIGFDAIPPGAFKLASFASDC